MPSGGTSDGQGTSYMLFGIVVQATVHICWDPGCQAGGLGTMIYPDSKVKCGHLGPTINQTEWQKIDYRL